jgi:signal transduction histidine kinase/DNA-binding response OmpR family regulator
MDNTHPEKKEGSLVLVDDDLSALQTMEAFLVREGYEVRCALDGHTALMFAREDPPELILLDVRLPDTDGFEVCRRLKEDRGTEDIPVIFISGLGEVVDKVKGFAAGGVDYITKPFQGEEMLARVGVHLTLRRLQKRVEAQNAQLEQEITIRKQAQEALQRAHDELEERIKERTMDLATANEQLVASEKALEERLTFERLLSDISARFVNISPNQVDSEIEHGLRQILEFFQVDRCGLLRTLPNKTLWQITHGVWKEGIPPVPIKTDLSAGLFPWVYKKTVEQREVVAFSTIEELPAEANFDKQTYREWKIGSCLHVPIIVAESDVYLFVIHTVVGERVWPEEFIPRLRLLGEILVNALERKQIRLQIEERLRFEGLISNLSAGFVNLPPGKVESQFNRGLPSITEFFDVSQCTVDLFSGDGAQLGRAFEYHSAETEPAPESLSKEQLPWYIEQLIRGRPVVMNRVEDFPPEAEKERRFCLAKGIKSLLSIPMVSGGKTLGSCALVSTRAERIWPEELVRRFRLISELFGNVLERKRAEVEAFHARRELLRLERLSRMGELTASLAHELNQPLTSILSNAKAALRFIQSGRLDVGELKEILQDIANDDKRAGDIIRSLRSMLKPDEGIAERVQINDVLADVVSLFHSEAIIRNLTIEMDFADSLPPVSVDKVQMQQVLVNLMMNAAQSMERGGSGNRKIILQSRAADNDTVQVRVRDFGSGVREKELDKIFEPFFSTKRTGLGMGLSLSRSIIEAHGGHIWVENHPDQGATFSFDLPLAGSKETSDPATKGLKR